jgi:hypothetical protein
MALIAALKLSLKHLNLSANIIDLIGVPQKMYREPVLVL